MAGNHPIRMMTRISRGERLTDTKLISTWEGP
jgi:hypothetical protein